MHRELRKLLEGATGISQHIIAIVLDIRGFTPFCERVDSLDVATYVKKVYMKILDNYFADASFFKPTGDGLLIIIPYDDESLSANVNRVIESCLELVRDFRDLCLGDPMINFDTPTDVGIGIARGSACCITSGEKVLDYSGKVLNLASRLMNVARPAGIVFDSSFGLMLLLDKTREVFLEDSIFIRGIADKKPMSVYYTKEHTIISDSFKTPIVEERWEFVEKSYTIKELKAFATNYLRFNLERKPTDKSKVFGEVTHEYVPVEEIGRISTRHHYIDLDGVKMQYKTRGKILYVRIFIPYIVEYLEGIEYLQENSVVTITVTYPTT